MLDLGDDAIDRPSCGRGREPAARSSRRPEDATFAKLLALLEELGNLSLEEAEIFFRKKNEIWEMTSGDPEFPAEKTFKTVEELAASADPETGFPPSGV
ncbi:hypothetical protein HB771_19210 [Rhizobium leguminosarum bv. viciae]|nr:hypothetical protein HB771_19210 [Rhizobium leguminosarum bv. viciae]